MKKMFEMPVVNVERFEVTDVVTLSDLRSCTAHSHLRCCTASDLHKIHVSLLSQHGIDSLCKLNSVLEVLDKFLLHRTHL